MSDRIFSYTVILDGQYKDEDAQAIQEAIEMIKGVSKVVPKVADMELAFAVDQAAGLLYAPCRNREYAV